MPLTGQIGTSDSTLGNIELGLGSALQPPFALSGADQFGMQVVTAASAIRVTQVYVEFLASETATGCARLVGPMRIKTRLTGGVLA